MTARTPLLDSTAPADSKADAAAAATTTDGDDHAGSRIVRFNGDATTTTTTNSTTNATTTTTTKAWKKALQRGWRRGCFGNRQRQGWADTQDDFVTNAVQTHKYNVLSFLPRNLLEQFFRVSNSYFLFIAGIQQIPGVSPVGRYSTLGPLLLVLAVTAAKEAIEDYQRYLNDVVANARITHVLQVPSAASLAPPATFQPMQWQDLRVGDIVRLEDGSAVPADVIVLATSDPTHVCYIETANLDGETSLKTKEACRETWNATSPSALAALRGHIRCETPRPDMHNFEGVLNVVGSSAASAAHTTVPLTLKNFVPRGSVVKNTAYVFGVVVYTGAETKLMLNSNAPPSKHSYMEVVTNQSVITLIVAQLFLCFACMAGDVTWLSRNRERHWYLHLDNLTIDSLEVLYSFFTFLILFNYIIPISLYVTLEMVKVLQAYFINCDLGMRDDATNTFARAKTSSINEELGGIEYIFSDKTGTLTQNLMVLRRCSVGGIVYGAAVDTASSSASSASAATAATAATAEDPYSSRASLQSIKLMDGGASADTAANTPSPPKFDCKEILEDLKTNDEKSGVISLFLTNLAVCHTVVTSNKNDGDGDGDGATAQMRYMASSPDEEALVVAAAQMGFAFISRVGSTVTVRIQGVRRTFQQLAVLEFNSFRKRMSVIVQDEASGEILLFCKGADNVVLERIARTDAGKSDGARAVAVDLDAFARDGLRTLVVAYTRIPKDVYEQWYRDVWKPAADRIGERQTYLDKAAEAIEKNLTLLGATAIEDKLQDGVPRCLTVLSQAGIRVWVLTGDKVETAVNIALSARLLTPEMRLIYLTEPSLDAVAAAIGTNLDALGEYVNVNVSDLALVVDGQCLSLCLHETLRAKFATLAMMCRVVVCSRCSPLQKAQVVHLIRDHRTRPITLAIGDGANDVSMIQAAHVGVGISGKEGMQAVFAADFTISQFRFLERLLLVHGRWAHIRTAKVILYSFYKNVVLTTLQFLFVFYAAASGTSVVEEWTLSVWNVFFTSIPIIIFGAMDRDLREEAILENPSLYALGPAPARYFFNRSLFMQWVLNGVWHGVVVFFVCLYGAEDDGAPQSGMYFTGLIMYHCSIFVVNCKLAFEYKSWTALHFFFLFGTLVVWILYLNMYSYFFPDFPGVDATYARINTALFQSAVFWLASPLAVVAALLRDVAFKAYKRNFHPRYHHVVAEQDRFATSVGYFPDRASGISRRSLGAAAADTTATATSSNAGPLFQSPIFRGSSSFL